jgi:hypothetical protein
MSSAILQAVKASLSIALNEAFVIGLCVTVLALALTFFIKEIPLRRTSAMQDRAAQAARAEAAAAL